MQFFCHDRKDMRVVVSSLVGSSKVKNSTRSTAISANLKGIQWESVLFGKTRHAMFWMNSGHFVWENPSDPVPIIDPDASQQVGSCW